MEDRRKGPKYGLKEDPDRGSPEDTQVRTGVTSVDLGEDLLETTRVLPGIGFDGESGESSGSESEESADARKRPASAGTPPEFRTRVAFPSREPARPPGVQGPLTPDEITDRMESVRILLNESLLDEAKRILRQIILAQPSHVAARKKLQEVHELELKSIFGESRRPKRATQREPVPSRAESEDVMRSLDRDLELGVFADGDAGEAAAIEVSLFGSRQAMNEFAEKLESDLRSCGARDRMDIGIAFLEMGLFELAARQFRASNREPRFASASTALLSFALIQSGRPFEATLGLEPFLSDPEAPRHEKLEFMYLMGRAHERLRKPEKARLFFEAVREVDPHYRDVDDRCKFPLVQERRKK